MNFSLNPPLRGEEIKSAVNSPTSKRPPLIHGLLYQGSTLMIVAEPGAGKSTLSLQAALEASSGLPVFGAFECTRPLITYYIQKERPIGEVLERIKFMQDGINWNPENFILDCELQKLSFLKEAHGAYTIARIKPYAPDLIVIDPIYAGHGGLSKDEVASEFCAFLTRLQAETGASIWLNHHTTKSTTDQFGAQKDDPFYGSQWLKAHVTGSYYVKPIKDGTFWKCTKNSYSDLRDKFELAYDDESCISTAGTLSSLPIHDRLLTYLIAESDNGCRTHTFKKLADKLGVTPRHCHRVLSHTKIGPYLTKLKQAGKPTLYTFTPPGNGV